MTAPARSVRPLERADLPRCAWAGSPLHLREVARQLDRAAAGEVAYLVVLDGDVPVSIGGVDLAAHPGQGMLWQLATDPDRQGEGFGTLLIGALERAASDRGATGLRLGVEVDNPRAQALYERLGYRPTGEVLAEEWDEQAADGTVRRHAAQVRALVRALG